ncbi:hypothetical protein BJ742DRAFT_740508 [Cladochytrium replicatum]|nr:hypothetical protein BJ742DRAFT_740508 [Cladochytrium replicatum]
MCDVVLPPCVYPSSKPYASFTTLLHRFGRYDRIRSSMISDSSGSSPPLSHRGSIDPIVPDDSRDATLLRGPPPPYAVSVQSLQQQLLAVQLEQQHMEQHGLGSPPAPTASSSPTPQQQVSAPATPKPVPPIPTKRDRNEAIEAISYQMAKPTSRQWVDQRVALTPKQEIKMELARIGSAVDKYLKSI